MLNSFRARPSGKRVCPIRGIANSLRHIKRNSTASPLFNQPILMRDARFLRRPCDRRAQPTLKSSARPCDTQDKDHPRRLCCRSAWFSDWTEGRDDPVAGRKASRCLAGRVRVFAAFPDAELGQPLSQGASRARVRRDPVPGDRIRVSVPGSIPPAPASPQR